MTGRLSSFGRQVRGLDPAALLRRRAEQPPPAAVGLDFKRLLAEHKVAVLRFGRPLTAPELQGVIRLFGETKAGWAACAGGLPPRQYLRYDGLETPRELKGARIMEHRSGLVLRPAALRKLFGKLTATGGTAERPFVYEGFHTGAD
eukprot:SAG22_NODE_2574_length_2425_cov_2.925623_5_plen_146_part_00